MSDPVELGFRQRLAGEFAAELGTRIFENAAPPDTALPYATYRRVSPSLATSTNAPRRITNSPIGQVTSAVLIGCAIISPTAKPDSAKNSWLNWLQLR